MQTVAKPYPNYEEIIQKLIENYAETYGNLEKRKQRAAFDVQRTVRGNFCVDPSTTSTLLSTGARGTPLASSIVVLPKTS